MTCKPEGHLPIHRGQHHVLRRIAAVVLAGVSMCAISGCSNDSTDNGSDAPTSTAAPLPCQQVWAPGTPTDEVIAHFRDSPNCELADGSVIAISFAQFPCSERGVTYYYNAYGWGVSGRTWTLTDKSLQANADAAPQRCAE